MHELERTVRLLVHDIDVASEVAADSASASGVGAQERTPRGMARRYELDVMCSGEPDSVTGFLVDIHRIDEAVHEAALPIVARACQEAPRHEPGELLPAMLRAVNDALGGVVVRLRWRLSALESVAMETRSMESVLLCQRFEFAASHRLHSPSLSDEDNQKRFGKCNNPNGHGHNYQLEPVVEVHLEGAQGAQPFTLLDLERVTQDAVLSRLDHKHLNLDVPEFAALNPTVEHIAKVIYELLAPAVSACCEGRAKLRCVTLWETHKTSCTYPAQL